MRQGNPSLPIYRPYVTIRAAGQIFICHIGHWYPTVRFDIHCFLRSLLFEEKQHFGDCSLTGRFGKTISTKPPKSFLILLLGGNPMNRENKKKSFTKGYYKNHSCEESFVCNVCARTVFPNGAGSGHRNHCPYCLSSQHLDIEPGDREANCGGVMEPIAVWVRKNGEWALIHRCKICGALSSNRIAADDNPMKLMSLAMKPVSSPPFPLERIEKMARLMGGDGELKW